MSDIRLDDGPGGQEERWVTIQSSFLNIHGSDLILDAPDRRKKDAGFRRALVHDFNDGITINYDDDYPGGVTINGARIQFKPMEQDSVTDPKLPASASLGDLAFVHHSVGPLHKEFAGEECALWICAGHDLGIAQWQMIPLGRQIPGTA